ncbi:hypothetical protein [Desulfotalea psychrophila]|uniref:Uncharacterized protein n=1 Tax=Desulfotalea psychrophila (strain LSv54 / DSM 12343) TaxID=177439 RepID=Q6AMT8_DESPS|nr:hypothetical protein [Desulfotalea psychrophila]CAG36337.1 conserved hypothetical protein, N-terminal part [Desulfotalea psychrophila LSv54]
MSSIIPRFYFDPEDYRLLRIVSEVLGQERGTIKEARTLLRPSLHPHGIKTLASSSNLRIAFAVINLLNLLETGQAKERLQVLRSLHDEVLSSSGSMRRNTARVLIQIMKTLVRSQGSELEQLKLAHDFRVAASGKPRNILKQLRKYHLIEMPEEWNQLSFDDRVHDANTKGRKSPTHLIMDAWIKGIRRLTVVYYHYVDAGVVEELLSAAAIMDIEVHIGVEVTALRRGRFVQIIWEPKGFEQCEEYLKFLSQAPVQEFMAEGRKVALHHNKYVYSLLELFNKKHRFTLRDKFDLDVPCLDQVKFIDFIGAGSALY